jgi:hypothetical protein
MTFARINVRNKPGNHERWGKLVKTWSTGKNYVRHVITDDKPFPTSVETTPEFPRPGSFRQFVEQAQAAGVELFFDDGDKNLDVTGGEDIGFQIIEVPANTHCVKLPQKDKIEESEVRLQRQGAVYGLPLFYERIFGRPPLGEQTNSQSQKATLHAERVGEYTINTCG